MRYNDGPAINNTFNLQLQLDSNECIRLLIPLGKLARQILHIDGYVFVLCSPFSEFHITNDIIC